MHANTCAHIHKHVCTHIHSHTYLHAHTHTLARPSTPAASTGRGRAWTLGVRVGPTIPWVTPTASGSVLCTPTPPPHAVETRAPHRRLLCSAAHPVHSEGSLPALHPGCLPPHRHPRGPGVSSSGVHPASVPTVLPAMQHELGQGRPMARAPGIREHRRASGLLLLSTPPRNQLKDHSSLSTGCPLGSPHPGRPLVVAATSQSPAARHGQWGGREQTPTAHAREGHVATTFLPPQLGHASGSSCLKAAPQRPGPAPGPTLTPPLPEGPASASSVLSESWLHQVPMGGPGGGAACLCCPHPQMSPSKSAITLLGPRWWGPALSPHPP